MQVLQKRKGQKDADHDSFTVVGLSERKGNRHTEKNGLKIREEWERWLKKRLDNIDGKIKELEREYEEIARAIMAAPEEGGKN